MPNRPSPGEIDQWHKWFAIECNNSAWDFVEKTQRTADEDRDMLCMAYAAALHWSRVGAPVNGMRADLLLARVHSLLRHADLAWHYASRALEFCKSNTCEDWDLAFAYGEMAFAAAIKMDAPMHSKHYALAEQAGAALKDEEDRKVFFTAFRRIPKSR